MNRGTLRTFASLWVNDPNLTRYTAAIYNNILNIANERFAVDSEALFKDSEYTLVADDGTYALPSDFMWEKEFELNGDDIKPVKRYTLSRNAKSSNWKTTKGKPTHVTVDPEEARKQILLYPIPDGNSAGDTLTMVYHAKPTDMSSDSDTPLNGDTYMVRFHMGVAAWAAWALLGYEDLTPEVDAKMAKMWNLYMYYVNEAKDNYDNAASEPMNMRGGRNYRP